MSRVDSAVVNRYGRTMNARRWINTGFGLSRVAFGLVAGSSPERIGRTWIGDLAGEEPAKVILRALGARDVALGAGTAEAALRDRAGTWLAMTVLADLGDVVATVAARDRLPRSGVITTSALAGSAALAGLALLALDSLPVEAQ
jgi:hypothetical protein